MRSLSRSRQHQYSSAGLPRLARARRARRRAIVMASIIGPLVLASIVLVATAWSQAPMTGCVAVLAVDRTGSQNSPSITSDREREAVDFLRREGSCAFAYIATVKSRPGMEYAWLGPLASTGNSAQQRLGRERNLGIALRHLREAFALPAGGRTNYPAFFSDASDAVRAAVGHSATVNCFLAGDAINTVAPIDMRKGVLTPARAREVLERLRPLPDLRRWSVRFSGVTQQAGPGGTSARIAANARLFWSTYVAASGGRLVGYSVASA